MSGASEDPSGLVVAVGRTPGDERTVLARAAWSALVEPGDPAAGALVSAVGPTEALALVAGERDIAVPARLRTPLARWRQRWSPDLGAKTLQNAARAGVRLLLPGDEDWPRGLDDLGDDAPLVLWARCRPGPVPDLGRSIAFVGARAATNYGETVAADLAASVAESGWTVVSGGAYGIDGVAHRAAMGAGGITVAFLAGGLDRLYPAGHTELLERIAVTGAVLSEVPCGTAPARHRFLARNRLIAAATTATVVVEAGFRSGAISTANHAAAIGRPLGAVPGSVRSSTSDGCHRLLRERDAICIRDAADVLELASPIGDTETALPPVADDPALTAVLDGLAPRPRALPDIATRAGITPEEAAAALGLLELDGAAVRAPGGWRRA